MSLWERAFFFVKGDLGNRQMFTLSAAVLVKMLPYPDARYSHLAYVPVSWVLPVEGSQKALAEWAPGKISCRSSSSWYRWLEITRPCFSEAHRLGKLLANFHCQLDIIPSFWGWDSIQLAMFRSGRQPSARGLRIKTATLIPPYPVSHVGQEWGKCFIPSSWALHFWIVGGFVQIMNLTQGFSNLFPIFKSLCKIKIQFLFFTSITQSKTGMRILSWPSTECGGPCSDGVMERLILLAVFDIVSSYLSKAWSKLIYTQPPLQQSG